MTDDETFVEEPDDDWDGDLSPEAVIAAKTCQDCKAVVEFDEVVGGTCPTGDCMVGRCPHCQGEFFSIGPVLCKHCGGMTWLQRQQHRVEMWFFDYVEMPVRRLLRRGSARTSATMRRLTRRGRAERTKRRRNR